MLLILYTKQRICSILTCPIFILPSIDENYTDEDIKELIRNHYTPEDLKRIVKEEYAPEDIEEMVKDHYPPEEMKAKLLADYTPDELRDIMLAQYPGDELRDMLAESIAAMDETELQSRIVFNELLLKTDRADLSALEQELDGVLENGVLMLLGRENVFGVSHISTSMESHKTISSIFPVAFIAIAVLTIITTMSRVVASQRTQIGTLKALGFSRRKVLLHYLGYGFFASAAGAFLGVAMGAPTLTPVLYWALEKIYTLPEWQAQTPPFLWAVAAGCALVCTASAFFAVRDVLKECPAESLRPKASHKLSLTRIADSRLWEKLSFRVQWNLRDAFRGKVRTVMGIVGAMSAMALLIFSFSLQDTFDDTIDWLFDDIQQYNTQLILSDDDKVEEAEALAKQLGGQLLMNRAVEVRNGAIIETIPLTVVEGTALYRVTDAGRTPLELRDGDIALSRKLAQNLGVGSDGTLSWRIDDDEGWVTIRATIFHATPMTQDMVMTRATLEALGGEYTPTSIITGDSIEQFDSELVSAVHTRDDLVGAWRSIMEVLNRIALMLILAAFILSLVVLYNLGSLSFLEKERELATLKVLGFKSGAIRRLLLTQNLWFSMLGILAGIPLGYWLSGITMSMLSSQFDLTAVHTVTSLVLSAVVVLAISAFTNLLFTKKLRTLDMVAAFKSVD